MYGLGDIRRRYQEKGRKEEKRKLGHKRNPTDVSESRKENYFDEYPVTPKEKGGRSVFGSYKNIPIDTDI